MKIRYPKDETVWLSVVDAKTKAITHFITSKPDRLQYFAYRVNEDGSVTKLGKGKDPAVLEEKYFHA